MAKFSKSEREGLIAEARRLYEAGFELRTITEYISKPGKEVSLATLKKWVSDGNFERNKKSLIMDRREIMSSMVESFEQAKKGENPNISALDASQYASAFEKLSDRNKLLMYSMECYDALTNEILKEIEDCRKQKEKERLFGLTQEVRKFADRVVDRLNDEVFG